MKNIVILLMLVFLPNIAIAGSAPNSMKEFNKNCPAQKLCPELEIHYRACKKKPNTAACIKFIETMKTLSPEYDCQRSFDSAYTIPAIWLCGQNRRDDGASYTEAYYELLSKLKLKEAREYFASPVFRSLLDGHTAEEYYDRSETLEKIMKKSKMK